MASVPSTTVSLLSDHDQDIEQQPAESSPISIRGPSIDHASPMQPENQQYDSDVTIMEMPTVAPPDSRSSPIVSDSQSTQPSKMKSARASTRRALGLKHWSWEAINAVLMLVMIIATVITLRLHDRQPIPEWPLSITINALISTYAFVFKGSAALILTSCIGQLQWSWYRSSHPLKDISLFQDAGGPYGAFIWLCKLRLHQPIVALAAIITILGIALNPFFQQLAQTTSCDVRSENARFPTIPRTNYLNVSEVPYTLKPAVTAGFFQAPTLSGFDCSTGNCTFDTEYSTLAFCSKCDDVSDQIEIKTNCTGYLWNTREAIPLQCTPECDGGDRVEIQKCNVTTQLDSVFSASYFSNYTNIHLYDSSRQQLTINSEWRYNGKKLPDPAAFPELSMGVDYGVIYAKDPYPAPEAAPTDCEDAATNQTWHCRGYGAAKCFMQPCIHTYTAHIDSGQVNETLIGSTATDFIWGKSPDPRYAPLGIVDKQCITEEQRAQIAMARNDLNTSDRWLAYDPVAQDPITGADYLTPFSESLLQSQCLYVINTELLFNIFWSTLTDTLQGNISLDAPNPQQLVYLYNSGKVNMTGINSVFQNVAQTLTLWTRTNGDPDYSKPAVGQTFHIAACIQANWAWLTLSAVIALLTLLVLALTILTTLRQGLPPWKSSPLALLLHGPSGMDWVNETMVAPPRPKEKTIDLRTGAGMETLAARIWVSLQDEDTTPRLRQVGLRRKSEP